MVNFKKLGYFLDTFIFSKKSSKMKDSCNYLESLMVILLSM